MVRLTGGDIPGKTHTRRASTTHTIPADPASAGVRTSTYSRKLHRIAGNTLRASGSIVTGESRIQQAATAPAPKRDATKNDTGMTTKLMIDITSRNRLSRSAVRTCVISVLIVRIPMNTANQRSGSTALSHFGP